MKPILFSTPMVKAIREGRKTQTRRIVKPQPLKVFKKNGIDILIDDGTTNAGKRHYAVGDILWVRETWSDFYKDVDEYIYRADGERVSDEFRWNPSIHMPREAARIFLKVKNVRCERLQDISEDDADAEGIERLYDYLSENEYKLWAANSFETRAQDEWGYKNYMCHGSGNKQSDTWPYQYSAYDSARDSFSSLWELINAKRGCSWESNPWVWVYEFEMEEAKNESDSGSKRGV